MRFSPPLSSQLSQFALPLGQALLRQRELALQCLMLPQPCLRLVEISTEADSSASSRRDSASRVPATQANVRRDAEDQWKLAAGITRSRRQIGRKTARTADGSLGTRTARKPASGSPLSNSALSCGSRCPQAIFHSAQADSGGVEPGYPRIPLGGLFGIASRGSGWCQGVICSELLSNSVRPSSIIYRHA